MQNTTIMAVALDQREHEALKVQEVLTRFGCLIRVRLGVHDAGNACSREGLILLTLSGDAREISTLQNELSALPGVSVKSMEL